MTLISSTLAFPTTAEATIQPIAKPVSQLASERVLIVQYSGDYQETLERLTSGKGETYYAQKYSVEFTATLGEMVQQVGLLSVITEAAYDQVQSNGVRAIGIGIPQFFQDPRANYPKLIQQIEAFQPTVLIIMTPMIPVLKWAIRQRIKTIALLADSFNSKTWRDRWLDYRRAQLLKHAQITWVGNHGANATHQLQRLGISPQKLVPWDWPAVITPAEFPVKQHCQRDRLQLLYVGSVIEAKGVGEAIAAVAKLRERGIPVHLTVAGAGAIATFKAQVTQAGIAPWVTFTGLVSHNEVQRLMQAADMVIVPSHHDYPEGLPMTIYEGLCTRTPLIISDHPMFLGKLRHGIDALVFPAQDSGALAQAVEQLWQDPQLYQQLSINTQAAWQNLQIPVTFGDFILGWLRSESPETCPLAAYSLARRAYV